MIDYEGIAHELWAAAQLLPEEGITRGVDRIVEILKEYFPELVHTQREDGICESTWGKWKYVDSGEAENIEEMGYVFSTGEEPNNIAINAASFAGICAHAMQQLGGDLFYDGHTIQMTSIEETSGDPLSPNTLILYDGKRMKFKDIPK